MRRNPWKLVAPSFQRMRGLQRYPRRNERNLAGMRVLCVSWKRDIPDSTRQTIDTHSAATSSILVHIRDLYYSSIRRYKFCPRLPPASLSIQSTLPRTTTALCSLHSRRETSANDKNGSIYYFVLSLSILEEILRHPSPYREGAIK